jgi:hypothetical protein
MLSTLSTTISECICCQNMDLGRREMDFRDQLNRCCAHYVMIVSTRKRREHKYSVCYPLKNRFSQP